MSYSYAALMNHPWQIDYFKELLNIVTVISLYTLEVDLNTITATEVFLSKVLKLQASMKFDLKCSKP